MVNAELSTDKNSLKKFFLAEGVLHPTQVDMEDSSEEEKASIFVKVGSTCDSQEVFRTKRMYDRK